MSAFKKNVTPIKIPTPFAVGDVYCYLLTGAKNILVDCGHYSDETKSILSYKLAQKGLSISDIDEIWLTHGHPDHAGMASKIRDLSGADILASAEEIENLKGNRLSRELFSEFFNRIGVPGFMIEEMDNQLLWLNQYQTELEPNGFIDEKSILENGHHSYSVKCLPGHSPGHITFIEKEFMFGGDVLLSHISTNALIAFDIEAGKRIPSFLQYRNSLSWLANHSYSVYPGHGEIIEHCGRLARKYLAEQELRLKKFIREIEHEPKTILEIGEIFFPEALNKKAYFLVLSEIIGFMDWGIHLQMIEKVKITGICHYQSKVPADHLKFNNP